MNTLQTIFLIINIIGGTLVLLSYVIGLNKGKNADALWGGTPKKIRGMYTVSMLISAVSFFIFSVYIFLNINTHMFNLVYTLILISSALWIPLVNSMISKPSNLTWITIRTVLILVGLGTLTTLFLLLNISPRPTDIYYVLSIFGLILFFIHTGILDSLIWPYLWKKRI